MKKQSGLNRLFVGKYAWVYMGFMRPKEKKRIIDVTTGVKSNKQFVTIRYNVVFADGTMRTYKDMGEVDFCKRFLWFWY